MAKPDYPAGQILLIFSGLALLLWIAAKLIF